MNELGGNRDPRRVVRRVWRYRWLLLAILVALPAGAYLVSSQVSKTYEATAVVEAQVGGSTAGAVSGSGVTVSQGGLQLVETEPVAKRAAEKLDQKPSTSDSLLDDVDAELSPLQSRSGSSQATQLFEITASAGSPRRAAAIANAFADAVAEIRAERAVARIDEAIKALETEESTTDTTVEEDARAAQIQELKALRASQSGTTTTVGPATPPDHPASPKPIRDAVVGFVIALLLIAALIPLLLRFDRKLRETGELELVSDAPLLATIPRSAFPNRAPRPEAREAFETLRASLTYFNVDRPLRSVVIASATRGEGKTTVALNLAIAAARAEQDVIVVDGDLRLPQVATRVGLDQGPGLEAVLVGAVELGDALAEVDAGGGRLRVLGAGSGAPNAGVLLGSRRMATQLEELEQSADLVVIDTPPILAVSDALPLIARASGVVLVAHLNQSRRDYVERACQVIGTGGGELLGVVATGARSLTDHGYYVYGSDEDVERMTPGLPAALGNGRPAGGRFRSIGRRARRRLTRAGRRGDSD